VYVFVKVRQKQVRWIRNRDAIEME
jgi:hypothetical protein